MKISNGVEIIPAVMPKSLGDLSAHASRVRGLVKTIQVDIVDGVFASNRTWPYVPQQGMEEFGRIAKEEEPLPLWDELSYEIDLMTARPEATASAWVSAGARRLVIHIESTDNFSHVLTALEGRYAKKEERDSFGVELGLALSIDTPLSAVEPFIREVSFVQLMGIARIGFQGEPFDERVLPRLQELRRMHPDLILSVDGGVHLANAAALVSAGANRLVAGSEVFESDSIRATLAQFHTITS